MRITLDSTYKCTIRLCDKGAEHRFVVGTDISVGDMLSYQHAAADDGYYTVLDSSGQVIKQCIEPAEPDTDAQVGGGFVVTGACSTIVVGPTLLVYKVCYSTVRAIIDSVSSLVELVDLLATYGVTEDSEDMQQIINLYLEANANAGSCGTPFTTDATLTLSPAGVLSVNTASQVEEDNTLPVTSAAVYTTVGNINALLATI